jgi:hypothetical protein
MSGWDAQLGECDEGLDTRSSAGAALDWDT